MKHSIPYICISLALAAFVSTAAARLPAPAATPEAQAKAAEAAARTAWVGKTDSYKLCVAQDKVAAKYRANAAATAAASGKPVPVPTATPPCTDPGPFVYVAAEPAKPLEASGAHSPATTAASPPSTAAPAAATNPTPKP